METGCLAAIDPFQAVQRLMVAQRRMNFRVILDEGGREPIVEMKIS
jgi:hypothetical protein